MYLNKSHHVASEAIHIEYNIGYQILSYIILDLSIPKFSET